MSPGPVGGSTEGPDPLAPLLLWAAEDRVERARRQRVGQASLTRQAGEAATWRAVLVDLAERADPVVLTTRAGQLRGPIAAVGENFCVVRRGPTSILVAFGAVGQVDAVDELPTGFRGVKLAVTLAEALAELAADQPVVRVQAAVGPVHTGQLLRVGADVLTIRTDHPERRSISFNLSVVDAVTLS